MMESWWRGGDCNYMYLTFYYSYLKKFKIFTTWHHYTMYYIAYFAISIICDENINKILVVSILNVDKQEEETYSLLVARIRKQFQPAIVYSQTWGAMDPWAYITIVPVIPLCHLSISTHNWSLVNYLFGFYPFKFLKSYYHCIAPSWELSMPWTEPHGIIGWDRTKSIIECKPYNFFSIMYPGFKFLHTNLFIEMCH